MAGFSSQRFKIKPWGPPKLRAIFATIADAINERAPLEGLGGIEIEQRPDGRRISKAVEKSTDPSAGSVGGSGGSSSGTPVDIYGSLNGAPAVFHLLQTSAPTPIS